MPNDSVFSDNQALIDIGNRVRARRNELNFTIRELANASDTSEETVKRVEGGTSRYNILVLKRISSTLQVSADYLLNGSVHKVVLKDLLKALSDNPKMLDELIESIERTNWK